MNIVHEILKDKKSDQIALIDGKLMVSYRRLIELVQQAEKDIKNKVPKDSSGIALCLKDGLDQIVWTLAVISSGRVAIPLSHEWPEPEMNRIQRQIGFNWLVKDQGIQQVQNEETTESLLDLEGHDYAFLRFSSGTTGTSKGVLLSHQSIGERLGGTQESLKVYGGMPILWVLPMAFHFTATILLFLREGAKVILGNGRSTKELEALIQREQVEMIYASPMQIRQLNVMDSNMKKSLKRVISTSMSLDTKLKEFFDTHHEIPLSIAYGLIEVGLPLVHDLKRSSSPNELGRPAPSYDIRIDNESGLEDQQGEIYVRGPGFFDAYLQPFQSREEVCVKGYFPTGDLGYRDKQGSVILLGRKKEVINFMGVKVFPSEVEDALMRLEGVLEAKCTGQRHDFYGEFPVAEIVYEKDFDESEICKLLRKDLPIYMVPKKITKVKAIERTASGKMVRRKNG